MEKFFIDGSNGKGKIACYAWLPCTEPKGIIYYAHGVTTYAEREAEFLEGLALHGYLVVANDHMGHGASLKDYPMYFEGCRKKTGWNCACEDALNCILHVKQIFEQELPVYGIGFSLGSFIIRTIAIRQPELFTAIVLLGTGCPSKIEILLGKLVAKLECRKYGATKFTHKISKLTFETYNNYFEKETRVDWLCSNKNELNTYLRDPKCGPGFTAGLFYDLLCGMSFSGKQRKINKMNKEMPILMISGKNDAVGDFTKGIKKLQKKFKRAKLNSSMIFYEKMRHDVLHETNNREIYETILDFLIKSGNNTPYVF